MAHENNKKTRTMRISERILKLIEKYLTEEQLEECLRNKRLKKYNHNVIDGIKLLGFYDGCILKDNLGILSKLVIRDGKAYNEYEDSHQIEIKDILKYNRATFDEENCFEKMVARYKAMCQ